MKPANLILPITATDLITNEVAKYGITDVETGGFLISSANKAEKVLIIAMTKNKGIYRHPQQLYISGLAINNLFDWATSNNYRVVAQFHSHKEAAFLSPTDNMYGLNVRGFITTVIPNYKEPSEEPTEWGWWRFDGNDWATYKSPITTKGNTTKVYFDESGIE
jgi:hypothetical protein